MANTTNPTNSIQSINQLIAQRKQELGQARGTIQQFQPRIQQTSQQLLRATPTGQARVQGAEAQRFEARTQAQQQVEQAAKGLQEYEQQFESYLKTPSGVVQYAKEMGIAPSVKTEQKVASYSGRPETYKELITGTGKQIEVPYQQTTYTYTSPYGTYTGTQSDLGSQLGELGQLPPQIPPGTYMVGGKIYADKYYTPTTPKEISQVPISRFETEYPKSISGGVSQAQIDLFNKAGGYVPAYSKAPGDYLVLTPTTLVYPTTPLPPNQLGFFGGVSKLATSPVLNYDLMVKSGVSPTFTTIGQGVARDVTSAFGFNKEAITPGFPQAVTSVVEKGYDFFKKTPTYNYMISNQPPTEMLAEGFAKSNLYKTMQNTRTPFQVAGEPVVKAMIKYSSPQQKAYEFFVANKSPVQQGVDWLGSKGIDISKPVRIGGTLVPTPSSMLADIKGAYQTELAAGTTEPGVIQFGLRNLGEGYKQAGTALAETYFQSKRGKWVDPFEGARKPGYQYLPESKLTGSALGLVGSSQLYFVPVVGETLIYAPFGEAAGRRELGTYVKKNPFETALAAGVAGTRGYQFFKYATGKVPSGIGKITQPKEKPIEKWTTVNAGEKPTMSYTIRQSFRKGQYEVLEKPRVYKWLGIDKSSVKEIVTVQPRTKFYASQEFLLSKPDHLVIERFHSPVIKVGEKIPKFKRIPEVVFVERVKDSSILTSIKAPVFTNKVVQYPKTDSLSIMSHYRPKNPLTIQTQADELSILTQYKAKKLPKYNVVERKGMQLLPKTVTMKTEVVNVMSGKRITDAQMRKLSAQEFIDWVGKPSKSRTIALSPETKKIVELPKPVLFKSKKFGITISKTTEPVTSVIYKSRTPIASISSRGGVKLTSREIKDIITINKPTVKVEKAYTNFGQGGGKKSSAEYFQNLYNELLGKGQKQTQVITQKFSKGEVSSLLRKVKNVPVFVPASKTITPILKTVSKTKTGVKSIFATGVAATGVKSIFGRETPRTDVKDRSILTGAQINQQKSIFDTRLDTETKSKEDVGLLPRQTPSFSQTQPQVQQPRQEQQPAQISIGIPVQIPRQIPRQTPGTGSRVNTDSDFIKRPPKLKMAPVEPILIIDYEESIKKIPRKKIKPLSFQVSVRRRGKFRTVSPFPLVKGEALSLGRKVTKGTAAATFKLIPTAKKAGTLGLPTINEQALVPEFRTGKSGEIIQRSRFRISSRGEKLAIPLEAARLRRAGRIKWI